ncbi:MAG: aspartyl protease family protein [Gemmataceae bacterium]
MRYFVSAFVVVLVSSFGLAETTKSQGTKKTTSPEAVPFRLLKTQHMVVDVMINGKGPYLMIFDTGAPTMLLNPKAARETGVVPKNFRFSIFSNRPYNIKGLQLGQVEAKNLSVLVIDHPTVKAISDYLNRPLYGIVGMPFFAKFKMTLDYQAKKMTFVPTNYNPPDLLKDLQERLTKQMLSGRKKQLLEYLAPRALLGMQVSKAKTDKKAGVDVSEVLPKSAAATAGLKKGDRLLVLSDYWTDTVSDCYRAAATVRPGKAAEATIRRNGKTMKLTLKASAGL